MSDQRGVAPAPVPADVGIVAALAIETADLVDGLKNVSSYQSAPIPVIEGEHGGKIVAVALSGPGRPAASEGRRIAPGSGHRPRMIIAAGFAGALNPTLARNDLFCRMRSSIGKTFATRSKSPPALASRNPALGRAGCSV